MKRLLAKVRKAKRPTSMQAEVGPDASELIALAVGVCAVGAARSAQFLSLVIDQERVLVCRMLALARSPAGIFGDSTAAQEWEARLRKDAQAWLDFAPDAQAWLDFAPDSVPINGQFECAFRRHTSPEENQVTMVSLLPSPSVKSVQQGHRRVRRHGLTDRDKSNESPSCPSSVSDQGWDSPFCTESIFSDLNSMCEFEDAAMQTDDAPMANHAYTQTDLDLTAGSEPRKTDLDHASGTELPKLWTARPPHIPVEAQGRGAFGKFTHSHRRRLSLPANIYSQTCSDPLFGVDAPTDGSLPLKPSPDSRSISSGKLVAEPNFNGVWIPAEGQNDLPTWLSWFRIAGLIVCDGDGFTAMLERNQNSELVFNDGLLRFNVSGCLCWTAKSGSTFLFVRKPLDEAGASADILPPFGRPQFSA